MTRHRFTVTIGGLAMAAALAAACDESPTRFAPPPQYATGSLGILVYPDFAELIDGQTQTFTAYACPLDADGNPILGPDGVPGTSDDECQPVTTTVEWSVIGDIGSVSPTLGSSTTLTAALPDGSTAETGVVRATAGTNLFADASVHVELIPAPVFTVHPDIVKLSDGESVELAGWNCPRDANGHPDPGPDGVPGTSDDLCEPVVAEWSVNGDIGTVSTTTGAATTFTAQLPPGSTGETGSVRATTSTGQSADVDVSVEPMRLPSFHIIPSSVSPLMDGDTQDLSAWFCPLDLNGNPDLGPDGIPGTSDDLCEPVESEWSVNGDIGTVSPTMGHSTTFTAQLPAGSTEETGSVRATVATDLFAEVDVQVTSAQPERVLVVYPDFLDLMEGDTQDLTAWDCPQDANGVADVGPDGVPGTADDDCEPAANAQWSVSGDIGSISATTGASTTLTAALPEGSVEEQGEVTATLEEQLAAANVLVTGSDGGEPIGLAEPCVTFTSNGADREVTLVEKTKDGKIVKRKAKEHCRGSDRILISFDEGKGATATLSGGTAEKTAEEEGEEALVRTHPKGIAIMITFDRKNGVIRNAQWILGTAGRMLIPGSQGVERIDLDLPKGSDGYITAAQWQLPGGAHFEFPMAGPKDDPKPIINDAHVYYKGNR